MVFHPCIVAAEAAAVVLVLLVHADGGDGLLFRASAVWNSVRGARPPQHFYMRRAMLGINSETASSTIVPETAELTPFSAFERTAQMRNMVKEELPLPPGFEGPEKTLEMEFDPGRGPPNGLRTIRRDQWDAVLEQAQCSILDSMSNGYLDSYMLSESSLFTYPHKLVLKTCGTTALLRCLPLLLVLTKSYDMSLDWVGYSRKDFRYPEMQVYPHSSFEEECRFLQTMFSGSAYVSGPLSSDRWLVYVADKDSAVRAMAPVADRTLNIMMLDFPEEVAKAFERSDTVKTTDDVRLFSGIQKLLHGSSIQDHLFDPCGYSMNALNDQAYTTIHVAPEGGNRYASFETNLRQTDYTQTIESILSIFRPRIFTMTLFAERTGLEQIENNPFESLAQEAMFRISSGSSSSRDMLHYMRIVSTHTRYSGDYSSLFGNWECVSLEGRNDK